MFSPIDSYDDASVVFTFGGYSVGVWVSFILAVLLFIGFFARMIQHENRAYKAIIEHTSRGVRSHYFVPGPIAPMEHNELRYINWYLEEISRA